jgi:hypothetical protein
MAAPIPTPTDRPITANWPKMRPRFVVEVPCAARHVMAALRDALAQPELEIEGELSERHGVLHVPEVDRRFWSTQLGLTIEDRAATNDVRATTRVLGIFSPHPEIWTGFVFAIGTLVGVAVFGTMYAIVQMAMGDPPWALLAPLIATLLGGLVYTSTLVGQGLAAGEMYLLRSHLDDCLEEARTRAAREPRSASEGAQL